MITTTNNRAEALRAHLDVTRPGWRDELRADLDQLQPGWQSFPLNVWDDADEKWVELVLLANPEPITPSKTTFWSRLAAWLRLR